ncbi:hypothetical protein FXO37_21085 [Capsicum annuum]|nr:hypothetical protein FXO37_21085 [Capsicum annuum]
MVLLDGVCGVGGCGGGVCGHHGGTGGVIGWWYLWWLSMVLVFVVFVALVGSGYWCIGRELISTSQYDPVKTFSIDRNIMKNGNIDRLFKKSCLGCFLELPEDPPTRFRFPMMMVYGLLKRRIKYVEDDKDSEEGSKRKMDEIWINYYGMLVVGCKEQYQIKKVDLFNPPDDALIKKELAGATAIRRAVRQGQPIVEALHDQPTKVDQGAFSGGVVGFGSRHADTATTHDDEHVDAQEKINMFKNTPFTEYKDSQDKIFEKVEAISKVVEEFKSKMCVIPSKKHVDKILCLMRKRQLTYRKVYNAVDRIMDLDFCKKLKDRYDQLNGETSSCGMGLDFIVSTLDLDE